MDGNVLILMITSPADLSRGEMINAAFSFQQQLMGQSRSVCHLSSLTPPVHPRRTRAKHVCQYIQNVHFTDLKKYAIVNDIAFVLSYFWTIIFLLLNLFLTRNEKTKPEKKPPKEVWWLQHVSILCCVSLVMFLISYFEETVLHKTWFANVS